MLLDISAKCTLMTWMCVDYVQCTEPVKLKSKVNYCDILNQATNVN